jgi:hypothetical protein
MTLMLRGLWLIQFLALLAIENSSMSCAESLPFDQFLVSKIYRGPTMLPQFALPPESWTVLS